MNSRKFMKQSSKIKLIILTLAINIIVITSYNIKFITCCNIQKYLTFLKGKVKFIRN